jgi:hypothetical protein
MRDDTLAAIIGSGVLLAYLIYAILFNVFPSVERGVAIFCKIFKRIFKFAFLSALIIGVMALAGYFLHPDVSLSKPLASWSLDDLLAVVAWCGLIILGPVFLVTALEGWIDVWTITSFNHAFQRWTSSSPKVARARILARRDQQSAAFVRP